MRKLSPIGRLDTFVGDGNATFCVADPRLSLILTVFYQEVEIKMSRMLKVNP